MGRRRSPLLLTMLVAVACGADEAASSEAAGRETAAGASPRVALCEEIPAVTAGITGDGSISGPGPTFIGVVITYAAEHPDVYSAGWIDHDAGGTYAIAFTDDPEPHRAALAGRSPSPDDIPAIEPPPEITDTRPLGEWDVVWDVVRVERTPDEILQATDGYWETLQEAGVGIAAATVDVRRSRWVITLAEPTAAGLVELAELVDPDLVCVEGPLVDPGRPRPQPGDELDIAIVGDPPLDTLIGCEGVVLPLAAFRDAPPLDDAARDDVREALENAAPLVRSATGWFILHEDDESMVLGRPSADGVGVRAVSLRRTAAGWSALGLGGCQRQPVLPDGLGSVSWRLDPATPEPTSEATEVHLLVTEDGCASGEPMGERLLGPQVVETDIQVLIAFAAISKVGGVLCPGNPETAVTVPLDSPLGTRTLVDGVPTIDVGALLGG